MLESPSFIGQTLTTHCRKMLIEPPIDDPLNIAQIGTSEIENTPSKGIRVVIAYAGLCYHNINSIPQPLKRASEFCSKFSGYKDAALYSGWEVSGIIDQIGMNLGMNSNFQIGQRVVIYPSEELQNGYIEIFNVLDINNIIPIPDNLGLPMAAMLPTGGLIAMSTIQRAFDNIKLLRKTKKDKVLKIFIVGTGNLSMWAVKIGSYFLKKENENAQIFIASLRDEGYLLAKDEFTE